MSIAIKYPRTYHFPWSSPHGDDKMMNCLDSFLNKEIVVTIKMDGENCSMYRDRIHARSLDSKSSEDRNMVKSIHSRISYEIPEGWRFCGENLYVKHSIHYKKLKSYFYLFSIWNDKNICLSWDETLEWARMLNLTTVTEIYRGIWNEDLVKSLYTESFEGEECEGYVARIASAFPFNEFKNVVGKVVRQGHIKTTNHWRHQAMIINHLNDGCSP